MDSGSSYSDSTLQLLNNQILQFEIGNFQNFVYLIVSEGQAVVVDPQKDLSPWEKILEKHRIKLVGCLLTHTHWDHVAGVPDIARKYAVPIWVHGSDAHRLRSMPEPVRRSMRLLNSETPLQVGSLQIETIYSPGHSAGECCFLIKELTPWHLLTGDTVFVGNVGRCDLETGDVSDMFQTIQKLKQLPADTLILPGHNYGSTPTTTIGREIQESAAFRCQTVEELDAIP